MFVLLFFIFCVCLFYCFLSFVFVILFLSFVFVLLFLSFVFVLLFLSFVFVCLLFIRCVCFTDLGRW